VRDNLLGIIYSRIKMIFYTLNLQKKTSKAFLHIDISTVFTISQALFNYNVNLKGQPESRLKRQNNLSTVINIIKTGGGNAGGTMTK